MGPHHESAQHSPVGGDAKRTGVAGGKRRSHTRTSCKGE